MTPSRREGVATLRRHVLRTAVFASLLSVTPAITYGIQRAVSGQGKPSPRLAARLGADAIAGYGSAVGFDPLALAMTEPRLHSSQEHIQWFASGAPLYVACSCFAAFSAVGAAMTITALAGSRGEPSLSRNVALSWLCLVSGVIVFFEIATHLPIPFRNAVTDLRAFPDCVTRDGLASSVEENPRVVELGLLFVLVLAPSAVLVLGDVWVPLRKTLAIAPVSALCFALATVSILGASPTSVSYAVATVCVVTLAAMSPISMAPRRRASSERENVSDDPESGAK
jgi:hypothetical protein